MVLHSHNGLSLLPSAFKWQPTTASYSHNDLFSTASILPSGFSSGSPAPEVSSGTHHRQIMTQPQPVQWNLSTGSKHRYQISPTGCLECDTTCTDMMCSSSGHLTSQCTDQCVVAACSDPEHNNLSSTYDFICNEANCIDCSGFDTFVSSLSTWALPRRPLKKLFSPSCSVVMGMILVASSRGNQQFLCSST